MYQVRDRLLYLWIFNRWCNCHMNRCEMDYLWIFDRWCNRHMNSCEPLKWITYEYSTDDVTATWTTVKKWIPILNTWRHVRGQIALGVAPRCDGSVAGEGRVVGLSKFHSWGKYTMPLTNINSDWMSNASSGLCIILVYIILAEWLTASLSGFKGGPRHELTT